MAGYSGTPLVKKLGIKPGSTISLLNAPQGFATELGDLPEGVKLDGAGKATLDFVLLFVKSQAELQKEFAKQAKRLAQAGMLWVSWPKKASGVTTDLSENVVRDHGLKVGLVDVKVCAVNDIWSGLKFVIRLKDRKA